LDETSRPRPWRAPAALACAAFLVYCANSRWVGASDTLSTELVPIALLTHGSLDLTELNDFLAAEGILGATARSRFGMLPAYPVATGLAVTPIYVAPVAFLARSHPTAERWLRFAKRAGKLTAGGDHGELAVQLSYHLSRRDTPARRWEGLRTPLPGIVSPGEAVLVPLRLRAPEQPGVYVVEVSLVQEMVAWFDNQRTPPARLWLSVGAPLAEGLLASPADGTR
jgi:hypothetical protein